MNIDEGDDDGIDVSFIVPAKNEERSIVGCLAAIARCRKGTRRVEICVLDNGSSDRTVSLARACGARVFERPDLNVSGLRNHGARESRGRYLAFVDADITLGEGWLENALREIAVPGVAAVGSSPELPRDSRWPARAWRLSIATRPRYCERDWLASANVLIRRDVFEEVGGFDESMRTCEDVDIGYRMAARYRLVFDMRLQAVHHGEPASLGDFFRKEIWRGSWNYRGIRRHGLRRGELPSLMQPLLTLGGGIGLPAAFAVQNGALLALAGVALAGFPVARTIQVILRSRAWRAAPALLTIWVTYSAARAVAALVEARESLAIDGRRQPS